MLLAPAPAGGFDHEREPDLGGERGRRVRGVGQPGAGARHAGRPQHRLHLRLVAEVARGLRVHAGDAQLLPDLRERHLQLLEHPDEPPHRADAAAERFGGGGDLPGVERVVDPPVGGQGAARPSGTRLSGSQVMSASSVSGTVAAASTNRIVASSR